MNISVTLFEDPGSALNFAREFLFSRPVLHNMILTLFHARIAAPEPGRYWIAARDGHVAGVIFQSPLTFAATITPMKPDIKAAMVESIATSGISLPGVNGEAATTASFAGEWAGRCKIGAVPFQGMRLHELTALEEIPMPEGEMRCASGADRDIILEWVRAFQAEVDTPATDLDRRVDGWLADSLVWLWHDGPRKAMAVHTRPANQVCRIISVYTPREHRRHGYASACVYHLSKSLTGQANRCILYTDLANPTSNSIYRRIGYRAVAEILRYRFE